MFLHLKNSTRLLRTIRCIDRKSSWNLSVFGKLELWRCARKVPLCLVVFGSNETLLETLAEIHSLRQDDEANGKWEIHLIDIDCTERVVRAIRQAFHKWNQLWQTCHVLQKDDGLGAGTGTGPFGSK